MNINQAYEHYQKQFPAAEIRQEGQTIVIDHLVGKRYRECSKLGERLPVVGRTDKAWKVIWRISPTNQRALTMWIPKSATRVRVKGSIESGGVMVEAVATWVKV